LRRTKPFFHWKNADSDEAGHVCPALDLAVEAFLWIGAVQLHPVLGWSVCRFHGARGGRPPTTGLYTMEAKEDRRIFSELLRQSRLTLADIK